MRFWNKKTPVVTIVLVAIVDVTSFISFTGSPLGYWPPVLLLAAIILTILNNLGHDQSIALEGEPDGDSLT